MKEYKKKKERKGKKIYRTKIACSYLRDLSTQVRRQTRKLCPAALHMAVLEAWGVDGIEQE